MCKLAIVSILTLSIAELEVSSNTNFVIEFEKEYDNRKIEEKQLFQDSRVFSDRQVKWFIFLSEIFRLFGKDTAKSLHFFVKNILANLFFKYPFAF